MRSRSRGERRRKGAGSRGRLGAASEFFRLGSLPDRMPVGHRDSPVGHGARRIARRDAAEDAARLLVEKRVEEGDAALEVRRDLRGAGDGQIDATDPPEIADRGRVGRRSSGGGAHVERGRMRGRRRLRGARGQGRQRRGTSEPRGLHRVTLPRGLPARVDYRAPARAPSTEQRRAQPGATARALGTSAASSRSPTSASCRTSST